MVCRGKIGLSGTEHGLGRPHLPENLLLRDTLYLLQGISGKYVRFSAQDDSETENKLLFVEDSVRIRGNNKKEKTSPQPPETCYFISNKGINTSPCRSRPFIHTCRSVCEGKGRSFGCRNDRAKPLSPSTGSAHRVLPIDRHPRITDVDFI